MVRAKFRVLGINRRLTHTTVELQPVIAKNDDWPEGSAENRLFWEASPSGEIELDYKPLIDVPWELGAYIYIDMEPQESEGRSWKLWEVSQGESHFRVSFGLSYLNDTDLRSGKFQLGIDNEKAWGHFLGKHGSKWKITFTPAEGHHPNCPYTAG